MKIEEIEEKSFQIGSIIMNITIPILMAVSLLGLVLLALKLVFIGF